MPEPILEPLLGLLEVRDLNIRFGEKHAVRGISFAIHPGEALGLVGESGSGKSVTSLAIMRLLPPQAAIAGEILYAGRNLAALKNEEMRRLRGSEVAMMFQEPMTALNPVMRICEQIVEAVFAHERIGKAAAKARAIDGLREVGIPEPERRFTAYPHQLSGGQRQRVMIAIALVNRPKLLIADEPTTALDVTVQAQVLELLRELRAKHGLARLFISHDLGVIAQICDRVAVMYGGQVLESGSVAQVFARPSHAYTQGLLHAIPSLKTDRQGTLATVTPQASWLDAASLHEIEPGHFATRQ
ncbi:MAG TPA: ABC transporter ATP-binding protein [Terriglobales bacterium]|nr:ABC transporter ATP-binding protein [Terriglobales bacterium]